MPKVDIRISCGVDSTSPATYERTITVSEQDLEIFFPRSTNGWGYWPRRKEAEALICSILREERFHDEVTSVQDEEDLRRIGVTYLSFSFNSKDVGHNMSTTLIERN